jgi:hypothetical protein
MSKLENKYSKTYKNIIDGAVSRNLTTRTQAKLVLGYVEKHHIIPKCVGGSDDKSNLVFLTAKEHFVCHHLLTKMFDDVEVSRKMRFAMNNMTRKSINQQRVRITATVFEKTRKDFAEDMSILHSGRIRRQLTEEEKLNISIRLKGIPKSKETKNKMKGPKSEHQLRGLRASSFAKKGTILTEEEKQKLRKPKRPGTSAVLSALRKGTVTAYDLVDKKVVKISKNVFDELKNIRYVGLNSKLRVKENV